MTDTITLPRSVVEQALEALTSYCNTGEIDGADDLLFSLLYEVDHADSSFAGKIARDAFIDLARQAGFKIKRFAGPNGEFPVAQMSSGHFVDIGSELATFAKLVIAALKLPQVEQGPVAWTKPNWQSDPWATAVMDEQKKRDVARNDGTPISKFSAAHTIPLYTHPQPPSQPLTEEQIKAIHATINWHEMGSAIAFARAVEAAHGIRGEA